MLRSVAVGLLAISTFVASASATERPSEIMHFWVSGSENAALSVIRADFTRRGGVWLDNPQKSDIDLRRALTDRLNMGTAPIALQWQGGAELREMVEIGLLGDYDALAQKNRWDEVLPAPVKDRIKYNGHYVLAPTGLHSENWIFYNMKVLTDNGIAPPTSLNELLAAAPKLEAAGITPVSIGKAEWETRVMFISVLLSTLGRDDFTRLVEGLDLSVLDKPAVREAVRLYFRLAQHLGSTERRPAGWAEATAAVGRGDAAFIFQGDWAKGELMKLGYHTGADFGCMLVPGTENVLSAVVDTFAFPRSSSTTDAASSAANRDKLIEAIYDPEVQLGFNTIKGSIPVRTDIPDGRLDSCAAIAEKLLRTQHAVISQPAQTMSTALVSDLHVLVTRMTEQKDFTERQAFDGLKTIFQAAKAEAAHDDP